ncbi:MAG: toll/interleukin-1 receptor domain-containing protein, partial [Planctomycetes bacterium]|nr:toll/interleukin-1 receptor domain-containing protein [Planctomycetota bacterium]
FKHDIFISYAHVDNDPGFEGEDGWVTTLERLLGRRLRELLGRDCFSVWRDQALARHIDFEPQIVNSLESSATLLLILSPGYLKSDWCNREMRTFLKMVRERGTTTGGVFVIEREKTDHQLWPEELQEARLTGFRFWTDRSGKWPRPLNSKLKQDVEEYYGVLNDLAYEMAECLQKLRDAADARQAGRSPVVMEPSLARTRSKLTESTVVLSDETAATVFLAETTDDIDPIRCQVKRHLEQSGLRVVPDRYYPRDPVAFAQAVADDLAEAKVFVQLLSEVAGRQMPDREETYVAYQHRCAVERQLAILQWRDPDLLAEDIEANVEDPAHRRLLLGAAVEAVDIEDFKHDVVTRVKRKEPVYEKPSGDAFVFVNTATADCPLAAELCQYLDHRGFGYSMPISEGKPDVIREDLRMNVLTCDGMIVIYGESASNWVRGQLLEARKAAIRRPRRLHAAVYEGPPTPKSPLGFKLPRMHVISCHEGLDEDRLRPFLDELTSSLNDSDDSRDAETATSVY